MLYIFTIAVFNLGLGFVAAVYLRRCCNSMLVSSPRGEILSEQQPLADEPTAGQPQEEETQSVIETDDDAAAEKTDGVEAGDSGQKLPEEFSDEPAADGEFAADLDSLFEEIENS